MTISSVLKWLAAAAAVAAIAGLKAFVAAVGLPAEGVDPIIVLVVSAVVVKVSNWLIGKLNVGA